MSCVLPSTCGRRRNRCRGSGRDGRYGGGLINQKRLPPNSPAGLRIADNLSNWGIVYGESVNLEELSDDLSKMSVTLSEQTDGQTRTIEQVASEGHMDPHYQSLAILAQRLADFDTHSSPPTDHHRCLR